MNRLQTVLIITSFLLLGASYYAFFDKNTGSSNTTLIKSDQGRYVNIRPEDLKDMLDKNKDIYLLDVHIPEQDHIKGTNDFIPFNEIENNISKLPKDKNAEIVVYCRSGSMSETASEILIELGYKNVKNLSGGVNAWNARGYE